MAEEGTLTICAVGDVADCADYSGPIEEHESLFALTAPTIQSADLRFCQLETPITDRGIPLPQSRVALHAHPKSIIPLAAAGFNVVSFACNHVMCLGPDGLYDTMDALTTHGIGVLGVGKNIAEARKPVIMERNGVTVGFLAYCSILPVGYWAEADRPGCAPMRAWTFYEQIEPDQPGTPPRIHTFAHEEDLALLRQDVAKLKAEVDVVVMSIHWGIHFIPGAMAAYQREVGHAAIDAGADLILGHHPHMLKPVEVYKGRVIFYSLGNFAFYYVRPEHITRSPKMQEVMGLHPTWRGIDPEYPSYQFPPESRQTMLARITIADKQIQRVSFLPAYINRKSQPEILSPKDKRFHDLLKYVDDHTRAQGLATRHMVDGNEIVIDG